MSSNTRNQILSFTGLHPGLHLLKRSPIRTSAEVVAAMNGVPKTEASALATIDYHLISPAIPCHCGKTSGRWRDSVTTRGIEPLFQPWEGRVLTARQRKRRAQAIALKSA